MAIPTPFNHVNYNIKIILKIIIHVEGMNCKDPSGPEICTHVTRTYCMHDVSITMMMELR